MKTTNVKSMKVTPLKALNNFLLIFFPPGINSIIRKVLKMRSDLSAIKPLRISKSLLKRTKILGIDNATEIKSSLFQLFLK